MTGAGVVGILAAYLSRPEADAVEEPVHGCLVGWAQVPPHEVQHKQLARAHAVPEVLFVPE